MALGMRALWTGSIDARRLGGSGFPRPFPLFAWGRDGEISVRFCAIRPARPPGRVAIGAPPPVVHVHVRGQDPAGYPLTARSTTLEEPRAKARAPLPTMDCLLDSLGPCRSCG